MIKTIVRSARQDALEASKPSFVFYFMDSPQYVTRDRRGTLAHMLKCYRANPRFYQIKRDGMHRYLITCGLGVACIEARA